jgi:hypothetical protein
MRYEIKQNKTKKRKKKRRIDNGTVDRVCEMGEKK